MGYGVATTVSNRKIKEVSQNIPYNSITDLRVYGTKVKLKFSGNEPKVKQLQFSTSTVDGERLYRELFVHYPTAVDRYKELLQ